MELTSKDFENDKPIPLKHSWKAGNKAPRLEWSAVPKQTKSFALIADDPDAPKKTWVHWVLFNIPADRTQLIEQLGETKETEDGMIQGTNDFKKIGYDGPYPPVGEKHRYFFKLYALDTELKLPAGATKAKVEAAMKGHILAQAQLMGTYERKA